MIKGAIFDMDGTLLDSMPVWYEVGAHLLLSRGIAPPGDLWERLRRLSSLQSAEYLRSLGVKDPVEKLIAESNSWVARQYRQSLPLKPGAGQFLLRLKGMGVKLCVATATDQPLPDQALERLGVRGLFDFVLTCEETGSGKDQPDIFLQALERLGTKKEETVVFEDAAYAIRTARSAGFRCVAVYDDSFAAEEQELRAAVEQYLKTFADCEVEAL